LLKSIAKYKNNEYFNYVREMLNKWNNLVKVRFILYNL
jgi:hypothetical protein